MIAGPLAIFLAAQTIAPRAPAAPPPEVIVSLRQIDVVVPPDDDAAAKRKVEAFDRAAKALRSCDDVDAVAKSLGASVAAADAVPLSSVPGPLRQQLTEIPIGTATRLFGKREEGVVRTLVLCARTGG